MVRPLPCPAGQEFALLSSSTEIGAKLTPLLSLLSRLCLGDCQALPVPQCLLAHHASHVPLGPPWSRTGTEGGSQAPTCLPSDFLGYRLGSTWHPAGHQAGSDPVAFSALGLLSSLPASPWQSSAGVSAWYVSLSHPASPQALGHSVQLCAKASPAPASCPLPVPGSPGKSSALKAKSRPLGTGQPWLGIAG